MHVCGVAARFAVHNERSLNAETLSAGAIRAGLYFDSQIPIIIIIYFVEKIMLLISATDEWRAAHPGAIIGLLELSRVTNTGISSQLNNRKREVEAQLRERCQNFTRKDFLALPVMAAYQQYYKRFKKTYHVQLQVESIVLKGKNLPDVSLPWSTLISSRKWKHGSSLPGMMLPGCSRQSRWMYRGEGDQIVQLNGAAKAIRASDMVMRDANGVSCSILYGQDNRSPISTETSHVLYVAYAPPGVSAEIVDAQLLKIEAYIRLFSPDAIVERRQLLTA